MRGVKPVRGPKDFSANAAGPGYYTPFDDSSSGWVRAREFMEHVGLQYRGLRGFNDANIYAREHWDEFITWYAMRRIT